MGMGTRFFAGDLLVTEGGHMLLALLAVICGIAMADLPVHCLHRDIKGAWTFHLSRNNMDKHAMQCSDVDTNLFSSEADNFGLGKPNYKTVKKIKVLLEHPNIASTVLHGKKQTGTWTMIYDEGFEVELGGAKFFAFHKFSKGDGEKEFSHCGETFPGWIHPAKNPDAKKWGCYHGIKDTPVPAVAFRKFGKRPISEDDVFVAEEALVQHVNNLQTTWKARHYKEHVGKPMALLQRNFGQVLRPYKLLATDRTDQARWVNDKDIETSGLPKAWDWTNVGGKSFLGEVVDQGACGSCCSVAVSEMISSRM